MPYCLLQIILDTDECSGTDRKFIMEHRLGLKELRWAGFSGTACEVEFLMYLLENAVELEKIVIDPMLPVYQSLFLGKTWDHEEHIKRAKALERKYLLGSNLFVFKFL